MTRRTALAAGLASVLPQTKAALAAQVQRIEDYDELAWLPALPNDPVLYPISILSHADMAAYWEVKGIEPPRAFNDETAEHWIEIGQYLPLNDGVMLQYLARDWDEMVGFSLWDADQLTVANDPPEQIRLYHGSFDPDKIADRLGAAGYTSERDGEFLLVTNPNEELDLANDLSRFTTGSFNHVAASESLVITSRSREVWDAAFASGMGAAPSLADQASFDAIAAVIAPMTGYLLLAGSRLGPSYQLNPDPIDGLIEGPPLPPARMLIAGITLTGNRNQSVSLIADLASSEVAAGAVDVITRRIQTLTSPISERPYREDLAGFEVDVVPGTGMVRVMVTNDVFATRWARYVIVGDLRFLATE